tara:strand:- start:102 stop:494 length:393 start_codon:yes stop_codon:yes gene_type:complete
MLKDLINPVAGLLDKFVEDKDQKAMLAHEIATMADKHANEVALKQIELNKIEASGNWLQRSWRPLIGMTCAVAFMWHFVLQPFLVFAFSASGYPIPDLPSFDMSSLLTVLGGLLGLGSLRTWEKQKGLTK